jgi:hypothetical protein
VQQRRLLIQGLPPGFEKNLAQIASVHLHQDMRADIAWGFIMPSLQNRVCCRTMGSRLSFPVERWAPPLCAASVQRQRGEELQPGAAHVIVRLAVVTLPPRSTAPAVAGCRLVGCGVVSGRPLRSRAVAGIEVFGGEEEGGGVRSGPGEARTILLLHIMSARPPKQPLMVRTFLKVYMELGSYFVSASTNKRHHHHLLFPQSLPSFIPSITTNSLSL